MDSILLAAILGLLAGMLVNYLSDILPIRRTLAAPICTNCGKPQALFNYFVWPRRCSHCRKRRGVRVRLVEIVFILLFCWLSQSAQATSIVPFWPAALLWIYFGVVAVIDLELKLILHPVSLAGAVLGLVIGAFLHGFSTTLLGGAAGYGVLLGLYWLGSLFTRLTRRLQGDKDEVALGFGDVNLAGVLGLILGWPQILVGLILSVLMAGVFSLLLIGSMILRRRYRAFTAISYGPFLLMGAILLLFFPAQAQALADVIGRLFLVGQ